ncbi:hypothetical protein EYZ11_005914 [Aspergillus tanneri]|uniref:DUF1279 domain-containing protein n=1 Tax=Aspergillus tanneri TaxID=1220188 RepID=A0A4S3JMN9_9EURO|nr:hypothetical protein EYZ11_005914 [Aspergillus tanneri]
MGGLHFGGVWPRAQMAQETESKTENMTTEVLSGQHREPSVEEPQVKAQGEASLWTQVALAYAIHKSLIFVRVPLTAAITPKVVKVLRQWGWDIVKGRPKGM